MANRSAHIIETFAEKQKYEDALAAYFVAMAKSTYDTIATAAHLAAMAYGGEPATHFDRIEKDVFDMRPRRTYPGCCDVMTCQFISGGHGARYTETNMDLRWTPPGYPTGRSAPQCYDGRFEPQPQRTQSQWDAARARCTP